MGFLNDLITTYDSVIGHEPDGMEKIAPIAHQYRSTTEGVIDVTINTDGELVEPKFGIDSKCNERMLIAMTEKSSARTSSAAAVTPHGINDKLRFMTRKYRKSYESYRKQLQEWCDSDHSCIQARAVLKHITAHDIVDEMLSGNYLPQKNGTVNVDKYKDYIVRWRVPVEDGYSETWKNAQTIKSWTAFYSRKHLVSSEHILDCIDGNEADRESIHAKPISAYGNSKLISTAIKEDKVLHFKGERFTSESQLPQIGYKNSQKLHNALSWLVDTQGIKISKQSLPCCTTDNKPKYLVCWRPEIPQDESSGFQLGFLMGRSLDRIPKYTTYISQMKALIAGTGSPAFSNKKVSLFMIDRSSDGRFSPVMYRSFTSMEFIDRIRQWHNDCAWFSYNRESEKYEMRPVNLFEIAKCVYGVQRIDEKSSQPYLDVDDHVFKDTINVLLSSVIDGRSIPDSLMKKLTSQVMPERFSGNKGHEMQLFNEILRTACALLHWIHMRNNKERGERDLGLDRDNCSRDYLYGRLLAVYDRIENTALNRRTQTDENGKIDHRDTNAMRLWSAFVAHPSACAANLQKCVMPYLSSLPYGLRTYYQNELTEIYNKLAEAKLSRRPLSPEYLHGFYLERAELTGKRNQDVTE